MFRLLRRILIGFLAIVGLCALIGGAWFAAGGISARRAPGRIEAAIAPRLRSLAIPSAARQRRNPVPPSAETAAAGLEHFADHCASCHANDGSGDTAMGRGLYPRAPDMRLPATQNLTDGELFYIIEHGVRLTGMPAWGDGTPESELASWHLVEFVRRLPKLTPEEIQRMEALNPKSPAEFRAEEDARKAMEKGEPPKPPPPHAHTHKHGK